MIIYFKGTRDIEGIFILLKGSLKNGILLIGKIGRKLKKLKGSREQANNCSQIKSCSFFLSTATFLHVWVGGGGEEWKWGGVGLSLLD